MKTGCLYHLYGNGSGLSSVLIMVVFIRILFGSFFGYDNIFIVRIYTYE